MDRNMSTVKLCKQMRFQFTTVDLSAVLVLVQDTMKCIALGDFTRAGTIQLEIILLYTDIKIPFPSQP